MSVQVLLQELVHDEALDTAWARLERYMAGHGFDRLLYAATHFRTITNPGDVRDALILTNYPQDYIDAYLGGGMFRDAPLVRWALENVGSISWRDVARAAQAGELTAPELAVMEFNRQRGITAGYALSFPRHSERTGYGIGLGATGADQDALDAVWAAHGAEIELVAGVAHLKFISLPHDHHDRALTPRQREVLELVADGKTVQDAALVLGLGAATVEKHLRLAREALDVETTAQAIRKLSTQNQFFLFRR